MPGTSEAIVDLRNLAPPEPLVRILEALGSGEAGPFVFLLAMEPRPLYPMLARSDWICATRLDECGVLLTVARRERNP